MTLIRNKEGNFTPDDSDPFEIPHPETCIKSTGIPVLFLSDL